MQCSTSVNVDYFIAGLIFKLDSLKFGERELREGSSGW